MKTILNPLIVLVLVASSWHVQAQKLPSPSRTVFKCEKEGKVVYSDVPCLGAERIDVQPTQGLNRSSGKERIGADVRSERHNELMAEAFRPIFDESVEQRTKRHRRFKLTPESQFTCAKLDQDVMSAEREEKQYTGAMRNEVQQRLLRMRTQFRDLKC